MSTIFLGEKFFQEVENTIINMLKNNRHGEFAITEKLIYSWSFPRKKTPASFISDILEELRVSNIETFNSSYRLEIGVEKTSQHSERILSFIELIKYLNFIKYNSKEEVFLNELIIACEKDFIYSSKEYCNIDIINGR